MTIAYSALQVRRLTCKTQGFRSKPKRLKNLNIFGARVWCRTDRRFYSLAKTDGDGCSGSRADERPATSPGPVVHWQQT
jgi:hypothetical protein